MPRAVLGVGLVLAGVLCLAAPAQAAFTATTQSEHDRFGVDSGFASAQDFDTTAPGTQALPSTFAASLTVDGGSGQDTLRFGGRARPAERP